MSLRELAKSESKLKGELSRIHGELSHTREALGRLARYHAERGTPDEGTFETARAPLRDKVAKLDGQRDHLVSALPDVAWHQDEKASQPSPLRPSIASTIMDFSERQRLMALPDVRGGP